MTPEEYNNFTESLQNNLLNDSRVLGLIAVGSMAQQDYLPDQWSDHDFWIVVETDTQESFRKNFSWLPDSEKIIFSFKETEHGVKIIYETGHLVEFAVFDIDELHLTKVNRYRILIDKCNLEQHIKEIYSNTLKWSNECISTDTYLFGQFLTNLLVGVGRYRRGEKLSGHKFVKSSALEHLVILLKKHLSSKNKNILDNIDSTRRFEFAFPEIGKELECILLKDIPTFASELLNLAERELSGVLENYPKEAVEVIRKYIIL